jgi:ABC-type antimicrobial peptide transport system permease subunit
MHAGVPKQGLAVASLVLGIFSITFGWCCSLGLITAPTGIVLGIVSLVQIKNDPAGNTGKPLSIIGIVLGSVYLAFWIALVMLYGAAIFMGSLGR